MAINPVSHQGYITQLFQPLATGKNQGADQATATDQLDGIINSVKQHSFKVPEWMQKIYGIGSEVSDLGALASTIQAKRSSEFQESARESIDQLKKSGNLDAAAEYERNLIENASSDNNGSQIAGFVVKGNTITGFVQKDGSLAVGDPVGADARIYWGQINGTAEKNPYDSIISRYRENIAYI